MSSPAYYALAVDEQQRLHDELVKIAAYAAELTRDVWYQSERLGQRPIVRYRQMYEGPMRPGMPPVPAVAQEAGDAFRPAAANQVGRVTRETLRAIAFPTFVTDLINGTFQALTQATMQQMEAYMRLLENVGKTVDQFMADNISDNQARDWLAQRYPDVLRVTTGGDTPRVDLVPEAEERPLPAWRRDLNLSQDVGLDTDQIEETLVPAARRRLAETRLQMLSTMVLMGFSRIVVTGGKIRATMQFHIDASDRTAEQRATDFDTRTGMQGSFGFGPWSVAASMSISYVSSTRSASESELNVEANLTGEVEIHFKSDYFPLERFATSGYIDRIRGNTATPEVNVPATESAGSEPTWGAPVTSLPPRQRERLLPRQRDLDTPPGEPRRPVAPDPVREVQVPRRVAEPSDNASGSSANAGTARNASGANASGGSIGSQPIG
jgi:hypothetical protein